MTAAANEFKEGKKGCKMPFFGQKPLTPNRLFCIIIS
jgi:hypothetical protein